MTEQEFEVNRDQTVICEASGCTANATGKIAVKVGTLGVISVSVCSDCISMFQEPVTKSESEQSLVEKSLESQNKEKKVLEQVGSQGSNTILCASNPLITMSKENDTNI